MNNGNGGARGLSRRVHLLATAVLAGTAMFAAACGDDGGGKTGTGGGTAAQGPQGQTTKDAYQQALAFAKCIRENGVASFPDPANNGAFPNNDGDLDRLRQTPAFQKAKEACKSLQPKGGGPAPAMIEQEFARLLKYSKCMRENGMPNFPDPKKENGGVGVGIDSADENSPQYKKAAEACKSLQGEGQG